MCLREKQITSLGLLFLCSCGHTVTSLDFFFFLALFLSSKSLPGWMYPHSWLLLPSRCWEFPHLSLQHDQLHNCKLYICWFAWHHLLDTHRHLKIKVKKEGKTSIVSSCPILSPQASYYSCTLSHRRVAYLRTLKVQEMLSPKIAEGDPNQNKTQIHSSKLRVVKSIMLPFPRVFLYHHRYINNLFHL